MNPLLMMLLLKIGPFAEDKRYTLPYKDRGLGREVLLPTLLTFIVVAIVALVVVAFTK